MKFAAHAADLTRIARIIPTVLPVSRYGLLKCHFGVIAAAGFFAVEVLTRAGLVRCLVLFVIDLQSRRVWFSTPMTTTPPAELAKATSVFRTFAGEERSRLNSRNLPSWRCRRAVSCIALQSTLKQSGGRCFKIGRPGRVVVDRPGADETGSPTSLRRKPTPCRPGFVP